jgi:hypothetical protein
MIGEDQRDDRYARSLASPSLDRVGILWDILVLGGIYTQWTVGILWDILVLGGIYTQWTVGILSDILVLGGIYTQWTVGILSDILVLGGIWDKSLLGDSQSHTGYAITPTLIGLHEHRVRNSSANYERGNDR